MGGGEHEVQKDKKGSCRQRQYIDLPFIVRCTTFTQQSAQISALQLSPNQFPQRRGAKPVTGLITSPLAPLLSPQVNHPPTLCVSLSRFLLFPSLSLLQPLSHLLHFSFFSSPFQSSAASICALIVCLSVSTFCVCHPPPHLKYSTDRGEGINLSGTPSGVVLPDNSTSR